MTINKRTINRVSFIKEYRMKEVDGMWCARWYICDTLKYYSRRFPVDLARRHKPHRLRLPVEQVVSSSAWDRSLTSASIRTACNTRSIKLKPTKKKKITSQTLNQKQIRFECRTEVLQEPSAGSNAKVVPKDRNLWNI